MAQLPLLGSGDVQVLSVIDDYGEVGQGASRAHYVLAENGNEYIIKGPALTPDHSFVAANELIAARIAGALGLPLPDFCVIEMAGSLYFGSAWMDKPTFYPATTEDLFDKCENKDRVYDLVAFDVLVCNVDRHEGNLIVRRRKSSAGERHLLMLNDHSHCMVLPGEGASALSAKLNAPPSQFVRLDFVRRAITNRQALRSAVDRISHLTDTDILRIVQTTPGDLLPAHDQGIFNSFLSSRRSHLLDVINGDLSVFPNLTGGKL